MAYFEETFTIGDIVRKEIEVVQGSTLEIQIAVPGGTMGKTFVSQFQHKTYVSSTMPTPVTGVDLMGLFSITAQGLQYIRLSTPTATLLPGRYLYDVLSVSGTDTSTSSLREFLVLPSITSSGNGGTVLTAGSSTAAQISQHNLDVNAHPGLASGSVSSYSTTFTQADLSVAGVLVKAHGLTARPGIVAVFDEAGELVIPTETLTSFSMISIDLSDFVPIFSTWTVMTSAAGPASGGGGNSGGISAVMGTTPITSTGGALPSIGILPSSGSTAGSMSASDFSKLAAATAVNTASTIVLRDSSGNVAFKAATGSLTGTASNASSLDSQPPTFYLGRANHGGTQLSSTISDFDTQARSSRLDQLAAPTNAISLNSQRITGLSLPQAGADAVNKTYADTLPIAGAMINPAGVSVVDWTIPAGVRRLTLLSSGLYVPSGVIVRLGTSSGMLTFGYNSASHYIGPSANYPFAGGGASSTVGFPIPQCGGGGSDSFCMTFYRISPNAWNAAGQSNDGDYLNITSGNILLPGELTTFRYIPPSAMAAGSLQLLWEF